MPLLSYACNRRERQRFFLLELCPMMHQHTHHPHAPRGQAGRQLYGKLPPACFQQLDAAQLQHAVGIDASCNSHNKISCHKQQSWGYCRTQPIATPELPPPVTILSAKANGMWIMKSLTRSLRTPLSWLRTRGTHARAHTHTRSHMPLLSYACNRRERQRFFLPELCPMLHQHIQLRTQRVGG